MAPPPGDCSGAAPWSASMVNDYYDPSLRNSTAELAEWARTQGLSRHPGRPRGFERVFTEHRFDACYRRAGWRALFAGQPRACRQQHHRVPASSRAPPAGGAPPASTSSVYGANTAFLQRRRAADHPLQFYARPSAQRRGAFFLGHLFGLPPRACAVHGLRAVGPTWRCSSSRAILEQAAAGVQPWAPRATSPLWTTSPRRGAHQRPDRRSRRPVARRPARAVLQRGSLASSASAAAGAVISIHALGGAG